MVDKVVGLRCTGCEACASVCPCKCIAMKSNKEGFRVPVVDGDKCSKCGICVRTCPVINFSNNHASIEDKKESYCFKNMNDEQRNISSSGGVFIALAEYFVSVGGVVYGAAFNSEFVLHHMRAENSTEILPLIGSKYLQSEINDIYKLVKSDLRNGLKVLFVGMTCQVEGLCAYLKHKYENLYCVDLICMGVPSPLAWRKYIDCYFGTSNISKINFKDKTRGWRKFSFWLLKNDKTVFTEEGFDNFYMECMFKGYTVRTSCTDCVYKCEHKISDLTAADCWGCENYIDGLDDDKGLSMVIVHSEKGNELLNVLGRKGILSQFDFENVLKFNSNYHTSTSIRKGRKLFWVLLQFNPKIAYRLMGCNPNSKIQFRIRSKLRSILGGS